MISKLNGRTAPIYNSRALNSTICELKYEPFGLGLRMAKDEWEPYKLYGVDIVVDWITDIWPGEKVTDNTPEAGN